MDVCVPCFMAYYTNPNIFFSLQIYFRAASPITRLCYDLKCILNTLYILKHQFSAKTLGFGQKKAYKARDSNAMQVKRHNIKTHIFTVMVKSMGISHWKGLSHTSMYLYHH